jgi:hypothetical protein
MMRRMVMLAAAPLFATGGCVAKTAWDVATAPVKVAGKAVDWTTTSQEEADRNYGRKMREREAREGRERRAWEKACRKAPESCGNYDGFRAHED